MAKSARKKKAPAKSKPQVFVTVVFDCKDEDGISHDDENRLYDWLNWTFDNAPYDRDVGFPRSLETGCMVVGMVQKEVM